VPSKTQSSSSHMPYGFPVLTMPHWSVDVVFVLRVNMCSPNKTSPYFPSSCTYSKDSPIFDFPPKIKRDLTKNKMMDMDTEDSKVEEMEGDSCAQGHFAQRLPPLADGLEQKGDTWAHSSPFAASASQSNHAGGAKHEWSPHVLGLFFPVQPKKHKIQSLREIRMAQGHIDK
ncbi:hypothetical protein BGZ82_006672, partial [Podila clonocystis]